MIGVAAAELDDEGRIATDVTARQAAVDIHRRGSRTYLQLEMLDTVVYKQSTGELIETPVIRPVPMLLPNPARDHPMFMTRREMVYLREHPDEYSDVMEAKDALAQTMHEIEVWRQFDEKLRSDRSLELVGERRVLTIDADRVKRGKLSTFDGRPVMKLSTDKVSLPGAKQVFRVEERNGQFSHDIIGVAEETIGGITSLLTQVMAGGKPTGPRPSLPEIRDLFNHDFGKLDNRHKALIDPPTYPVAISPQLEQLTAQVREEILSTNPRANG